MSDYELIPVNEDYHYIIVATSYVNPMDILYDIEYNLENNNYKGNVVFDLLLCNGISANRYIEMYFNGTTFDVAKYKILDDVSIKVKKKVYQYYSQHIELVENSSLPKAQAFLLKKGVLM